MTPLIDKTILHLALPKGRMQEGVFALLADAGVRVGAGARGYRPAISLPDCEVKLLKPQNIVEMLDAGSRDVGFAGADWVAELGANVVEVLDTRLDPVRLVAAAPASLLGDGRLPRRPLVVASEYEQLTRRWIGSQGLDASFLRSYGATEVFPPEDADLIVDNTATGATLEANNLIVIDELMCSTTRLYANPRTLEDLGRRRIVDHLVLLLQSVLEARRRVMLEVNVTPDRLEGLCAILPCMREPTVSPLHGAAGYAVKAAVPRAELAQVIPRIKAAGGTDIVVTALSNIVP
jgi:ATP phosphoribosyltransferase